MSTRPLRKKKKDTNILANWPPKPAPPRGLKSVSKKRKSTDIDILEQPDPKKIQKITSYAGKSSAKVVKKSNNFGRIQEMFQKLESRGGKESYVKTNNPIGQPTPDSKICDSQSESRDGKAKEMAPDYN